MTQLVAKEKEVTLLDLLDRILNKGVILWGDVTISVADVDLIYLGLKVLLTSVETAERMRKATAASTLNLQGETRSVERDVSVRYHRSA
jgi:hypothetical protein